MSGVWCLVFGDLNTNHPHDPLAAALAALPHGPEFRFIDRLTRLDPGTSGAAEFTLSGDEVFLRGHFPG